MNLAARWVWIGAGTLPVVAVGIALFTQHGLGMQPCPWCVLQRLIFLSIGATAWIGLALGATWPRRAMALLMTTLAASGMAAALWQHFVAAASASCNLTLADRIMSATGLDNRWPEVFAPYASCADAAATLLGVPYEFYSFTNFVLLGIAAIWLLRRPTD
ncbi:MAG TPA: disulfide bond formation protein B [Rubrivivax sp.]|nr:disulfide bond formation protein B [Rubrivivax sp.]